MAKFLKDLLANNHPLFTYNLQQLEKATAGAGVDVRLISDITQSAHVIMRELRLDPADTVGEELYWALNSTVRAGSAELLLSDTDAVLVSLKDGPISFNLQDVIENAHHGLPYLDRTVLHGQRHLRAEIIKRYAAHDATRDEIVYELAAQAGLKPLTDEGHPVVEKLQSTPAPYILAIGDIVTDAFIKLCDDQAEMYTDENGIKRLSMEFGSKLPYERVDIVKAVGNSANAAVAFTRLGLRAGLMAYIGDDQAGDESLAYLASESVRTDTVSVQNGLDTNYHYALRYKAERTILIKYEEYDYVWRRPKETPEWIYLSMLSDNSWQLHQDMLAYLAEYPEVKLAFQPGTFHFEWGVEKLSEVYKRSRIVFMNREEASLVTSKPLDSIAVLADALRELGPDMVVITDGPAGAYAHDGTTLFSMPNYPDPSPPKDRTGAGDAFSSTITAVLATGGTLKDGLERASINSMNVVQHLGAQAGLLSHSQIDTFIKNAPANYTIKEME